MSPQQQRKKSGIVTSAAAASVAEQSISLCNEAVSLFSSSVCFQQQKDFQNAILKFSTALIVVKQQKTSIQNKKEEEQYCQQVAATFDIDALFPPPQTPQEEEGNDDYNDDSDGRSDSTTDDNDGRSLFVYSHLIRLPPLHQVVLAYEGFEERVLTIIQIVITFNLALVYHLLGATTATATTKKRGRRNGTNPNSSPVLIVAMGLYEDALNLFQHQHQSSSSTNNLTSTTEIFRLATLNNLANICILLDDEKSKKHYLHELLSTTALMTTSLTTSSSTTSKRVDPTRYEHFFETSMSLVCPSYGAGTA